MAEKKILIVDADVASRNFIARNLTDQNYEVIQAGSGKEGLICAWRDHPDLAIIDPTIADLKGEEIATRLKQDARTANMPLVALSSNSSVVQQRLVAVLPGAQLGRLQLVGGLQLKVVGSVLPLTDGLTLVLADVVVDGLLAAVRTGPAALRVKHAQGTLSGPWIQTVVVDLAFEAAGQATQVLDGVLRATFPGGDGQPVTLRGVVAAGLEGARAQVESLQEVALPFVLKATAQAQEQWELAVQADFVDTAVQGLYLRFKRVVKNNEIR